MSQLKSSLTLLISNSTLHRILVSSGYTEPYMTAANKPKCLECCMKHFKYEKEKWQTVLFTDKKKFIWTGPTIRPISGTIYGRMKRFSTAPAWRRKCDYMFPIFSSWECTKCFMKGRYDARKNSDMPQELFLARVNTFHPDCWIFQNNNARIHSACSTWRFL